MTIFISVFEELCELDVLGTHPVKRISYNLLMLTSKEYRDVTELCASNISIITRLNNI